MPCVGASIIRKVGNQFDGGNMDNKQKYKELSKIGWFSLNDSNLFKSLSFIEQWTYLWKCRKLQLFSMVLFIVAAFSVFHFTKDPIKNFISGNAGSHVEVISASSEVAPKPQFAAGKYQLNSEAPSDRCQIEEGVTCVDLKMWERLCQNSSMSRDAAIQVRGLIFLTARDPAAVGRLLENGGDKGTNISWDGSQQRLLHRCVLTLSVSGLYNGSQVLENIDYWASEFIVTDEMQVLVSKVRNSSY